MKVFEVMTEHLNDDDGVVETRQYVTHPLNCLLSVTEFYSRDCEELNMELKSVREVLVVCHQLTCEESKQED